jgi:hypothetical protein
MPSISLPAAILGAGALGVGGAVASGVIGSNAAQSAAQTQANAANLATNTQLGIFNQTQQNLQPYNQVGQSALSQLASLFGLSTGGAPGTGPTPATAAAATSALTQYPGYQFGLKQGSQALSASAASQGLELSGGQLAAQQQYGQNYAMANAWNPYVSQLNTLASNGQNAGASLGAIGATTGNNVAQTQLAAGQATAAGTVGSANALTGALNTGIYSGLNSALLGYGIQNQTMTNPAAYNNSPYEQQTGPMNSLGLVNP